ncbi:HAD hydrolase-like protein [Streptomyces sp. NPDC002825]|uniref:HAD family hydrolase n=1 Tax=Streptomyces sp. NPDC002825 TaxID=3154666 RepID=UPI003316D89C
MRDTLLWSPRTVLCVQLLALFDLDDTLVSRRDSLRSWGRDFTAARGLPASAADVVVDALDERARPNDFAGLRVTLGLRDSVESLWDTYVAGMAQRAHCREGVHEGLRSMKAHGWTIGIATNGAPNIQHAKVAGAGRSKKRWGGACRPIRRDASSAVQFNSEAKALQG